jgi:orotidine-5'-phosphate decarboxylase
VYGAGGLSAAGAVVGATKAADAQALRKIMPRQMFLIPGYGAQGGTADDIRHMLRPGATSVGARGVLVTASRSVIYPNAEPGEKWERAIGRAAKSFASEIAEIS